MAEDWRLTVQLTEQGHADGLLHALHVHEVEDESRERLGKRVAVSGEGNRVFLYADDEAAARSAQEIVEQLLRKHGMTGEFSLERWHREEEVWEAASIPLPSSPEQHRAEHERLEEEEKEESTASGVAEWEVRVELASHHDAHALGERLEREGFQPVRRWKYLLVGAADEDDAAALAKRLKTEAPHGAVVHTEPGSGMAWELMPSNPFAVFGGLSG